MVEALVEHVVSGFIPCPIKLPRRSFGLQRREEALHRRIVRDVAGAAHRTDDAVVGHQPLELLADWLPRSE